MEDVTSKAEPVKRTPKREEIVWGLRAPPDVLTCSREEPGNQSHDRNNSNLGSSLDFFFEF